MCTFLILLFHRCPATRTRTVRFILPWLTTTPTIFLCSLVFSHWICSLMGRFSALTCARYCAGIMGCGSFLERISVGWRLR
jgi:hypothetical protein